MFIPVVILMTLILIVFHDVIYNSKRTFPHFVLTPRISQQFDLLPHNDAEIQRNLAWISLLHELSKFY